MHNEKLSPSALQIAAFLEKSHHSKSFKAQLTEFFLSLALFIGLGKAFYSGEAILALLLVILIHELGHYCGMKFFNYRDACIRFVPLLGAYTVGYESNSKAAERGIITLLGPCPGILLGFGLWWLSEQPGLDGLRQFAILFLFINGFNLLPFQPLDGGRVLDSLLFVRWWQLQELMKWLLFLGLGAWAFFTHSIAFGILAVFGFIQNAFAAQIGRVSGDIRDWNPPEQQEVSQRIPPDRYLAQIIDKLEHEEWFRQIQDKENSVPAQARLVETIWGRIRLQYTDWKTTCILLCTYITFLLMSVPFIDTVFRH